MPWLYLKGVSSGEMSGVLGVLLGEAAQGFSASSVSRLAQQWSEERERGVARSLSGLFMFGQTRCIAGFGALV